MPRRVTTREARSPNMAQRIARPAACHLVRNLVSAHETQLGMRWWWLLIATVGWGDIGKPGGIPFPDLGPPPSTPRDAEFVPPDGPPPSLSAQPHTCAVAMQCASGVCEGQGCSRDRETGHCAPAVRTC